VVITIIGILVALMMPAINSAREAGRRITCGNHLKQIGLAFLAHHEAMGAFPNGGYTYGSDRTLLNGAPATYVTQKWSWGYQILPYIDETPLWSNPDNVVVSSTPISSYFCPTRRRPVALAAGSWQTIPKPRAMADYAGNAGTTNAGGDGSGVYGDGRDGVVARMGSGVVTANDLTDGASNTILLGEKRMNLSFVTTECQADDNDGYVGGYQDDVVRWGAWPPEQDTFAAAENYSTIHPRTFQFGSSHSAGAQFVLGDGSMRLINFTVNADVFRRACCRNDGEAFDTSAL
jgi:hypothetical protein